MFTNLRYIPSSIRTVRYIHITIKNTLCRDATGTTFLQPQNTYVSELEEFKGERRTDDNDDNSVCVCTEARRKCTREALVYNDKGLKRGVTV